MKNALKLSENTIAKNRKTSSPRTATKRRTDRFSGRFKAVGFVNIQTVQYRVRITGRKYNKFQKIKRVKLIREKICVKLIREIV